MRAIIHELDLVVLEAVSEEYQSFESVVSKLSHASDDRAGINGVEHALLRSIANKLVAAYLLHADPPYATEVEADADNIQRYWFCITQTGREYLRRVTREQTVFGKLGTK